jgi:hypothetical protein
MVGPEIRPARRGYHSQQHVCTPDGSIVLLGGQFRVVSETTYGGFNRERGEESETRLRNGRRLFRTFQVYMKMAPIPRQVDHVSCQP